MHGIYTNSNALASTVIVTDSQHGGQNGIVKPNLVISTRYNERLTL
jgi:tRNA1(Val) A37 N6-methylase TrmN6